MPNTHMLTITTWSIPTNDVVVVVNVFEKQSNMKMSK